MDEKEFGLKRKNIFMNVKSPASLITLKHNKSFCMGFFNKRFMSATVDASEKAGEARELVYDTSRLQTTDEGTLNAIMELLSQLRAAVSDQNISVQNNTVIREQILNQLKNEVLKVSHKLTNNQIKNLEVVSSNNFDEKTLADILKSLLQDSKKKLTDKPLPTKTSSKKSEQNLNEEKKIFRHRFVFDKLHTKLPGINLSGKAGSFAENIVQNAVPRAGILRPELTNKISDFSKVNELKEDVTKIHEEHTQDKTYYEQNVKKIQTEVEKVYNAKKISRNILQTSKNISTKKNTLIENLNTNLLKFTTTSKLNQEVKNVNENEVLKLSENKITQHGTLINKTMQTQLSTEEKEVLKDVVNLRRSGITLDKKLIENVYKNNVLIKDIRTHKNIFKRTHGKVDSRTTQNYLVDNFKTNFLEFSNIKTDQFTFDDFSEYVLRYENIHKDSIKRRNFAVRYHEIAQELEKRIKEETLLEIQKNIYEKFKINSLKTDKRITRKIFDKFLPFAKNDEVLKSKTFSHENIYKLTPKYIYDDVLDEEKIENIISKNIINVLSPQLIKNKKIKTNIKNIHKNSMKYVVDKYIKQAYDLQKEYLVHNNEVSEQNLNYEHMYRDYLIHKEKEKYDLPKKEDKKPEYREKTKELEPDVVIENKPQNIPTIDTQAIEKNIIAKTLKKSDVFSLIQSYMSNVGVESISDKVIDKIEREMLIERQRNGIF